MAAILVIYYGFYFLKKLKKDQLSMKTLRKISKMIFALVMLAAFTSTSAFACTVCSGRSDSSLAVGMNWGIFTLMGVIVTVLATFAGIFYLHRSPPKRVRQGGGTNDGTKFV